MWETAEWQQLLDGPGFLGIRPVLRPALPPDLDQAMQSRRHPVRRQFDRAPARGEASARVGTAACRLLEKLDLAIVLLRADRCLQFANQAAVRLAARGDCIRIRGARLHLADRHEQTRLETFLGDRAAGPAFRFGPTGLRRGGDGARSYIIEAEWQDLPTAAPRAIASLVVYEPGRIARIDPEFLGRLYGLTRMESRLAAAIFDSFALRTAAARCGIGLNTAKTHLKQVFLKCGVASQAQLLRVLALGPRSS